MLKSLTGKTTQQHIHLALTDKAKVLLNQTGLTTAEIAYRLGFEHPQSFNRLFKQRTNLSPVQYRDRLRGIELSIDILEVFFLPHHTEEGGGDPQIAGNMFLIDPLLKPGIMPAKFKVSLFGCQ